jgi:6-phosphofructokinase 2
MKRIATLTMNPTIDASYEVDRVCHTHKMRTRNEHYDPGGGGINVARVFCRLGGAARCHYVSGGATGIALDGLVAALGLDGARIPIAAPTRIAGAVHESETGKEYRFTPAGPELAEGEWQACLEQAAGADCDYFVASGSLPPGVPHDFYARIARVLRARGIAFVLDTSGEALAATLAEGGVHLVKPSLGELRQLAGHPLATREEIAAAAMDLVKAGRAQLVAVTMGHEGALLARAEGTLFLPAVPIEARSAVGAGDSFLATMLHALASGMPADEAFRRGMAGGAASVLNPGTGLARPEDIERLLRLVPGG